MWIGSQDVICAGMKIYAVRAPSFENLNKFRGDAAS
jgi:hypothetical protein